MKDPIFNCFSTFSLGILIFIQVKLVCQENEIPFKIENSIFDTTDINSLGLKSVSGIKTYTIFKPGPKDYHYNHGVVVFYFKGYFYAQWQSSVNDEDAPETRVMFSKSRNGKKWTKPEILAISNDHEIVTNGGWWQNGDSLIAFLCYWPKNNEKRREGYTDYISSSLGKKWSQPAHVLDCYGNLMNGIIEQDLHALPGGRILTAFHMQPGLVATPYFTDNCSGTQGWIKANMTNLPFEGAVSRELEPSWYLRADGSVVMVFRDQAGSFMKLASISYDNGKNWTIPVLTNFPDSRAKQSAGNLPDGTAFQVNNPSGNKNRFPLVICLSKDGKFFDKAYLIRSGGKDLPQMRYEGKFKRPGFSYPKSFVWKNLLYVSYATNKEDIGVSIISIRKMIRY